MAESEEELNILLMKVKEESEKVDVKLNIQKTKTMASDPINSWEIGGETVETVRDFIFLGSRIIADDEWSHEIKRCLLLGRKVMTNLDSILKSRDITLPTKVRLVKAIVFFSSHRWMWELDYKESWMQRINAFFFFLPQSTENFIHPHCSGEGQAHFNMVSSWASASSHSMCFCSSGFFSSAASLLSSSARGFR